MVKSKQSVASEDFSVNKIDLNPENPQPLNIYYYTDESRVVVLDESTSCLGPQMEERMSAAFDLRYIIF